MENLRGANIFNLRAVIFDLDGVVIDSKEFHQAAWRRFGLEAGFPVSDEFFIETFGMTNASILPRLFGRELSMEEFKNSVATKETYYLDSLKGKLIALPGALPLIRQIRSQGIKTALGTSAPPKNVQFVLTELNAERLFDAISQEGDYKQGKPYPDVFLEAARRLDVAASEAVVIEDAVAGVQAAKAAGMRCVAVTTTSARQELEKNADLVVDSLEELTVKTLCAL